MTKQTNTDSNDWLTDLFMRAGLPSPDEDETSAQLMQAIQSKVDEMVREAIELTWEKSGEGYNSEYPVIAKDGTVILDSVRNEVLAQLSTNKKG